MNVLDVILNVLKNEENGRCKRGDLIKKVKERLANPDVSDGAIDSVIDGMVSEHQLQARQLYLDNGVSPDKNNDDIFIQPKEPVKLPKNVKH